MPDALPVADLDLGGVMQRLSKADQALARLDGAASVLPDRDLFLFMYVRREAVLSSQIEGTQASLNDLLEAEARAQHESEPIQEVGNYVAALDYGLQRLSELPVSLRLIREIHGRLMKNARGGEALHTPGEFRRAQNWIGGSSPNDASFVPPPAPEPMSTALGDWERYVHADHGLPDLVHVAILHAQFETIHPFVDGNGRVGRLLIPFLLAERGILRWPLLYLSIFLKRHRDEYYTRLQSIRDHGAWEDWIAFFIEGVIEVATEAGETARKILDLRERDRERLYGLGRRSSQAHRLLDVLFRSPYVMVKNVVDALGLSQPAANALVNELARIGLLVEITGKQRNRIFTYAEYMDLFSEREDRG